VLFNSYTFIALFLPLTVLGFWLCGRFRWNRGRIVWLTLTSFFFYGYWKPIYLLLLLASISSNYAIGRQIEAARRHNQSSDRWLWLGIALNLALLGYYKYAGFSVATLDYWFDLQLAQPAIILPLAISFYTFTQIAYLVDAHRGETLHLRYNWLSYSLFITFFPQLIAGPILRSNELLPQLQAKDEQAKLNSEHLARGLTLFVFGLAKKVLIADSLSPWVEPVFSHAAEATFLEVWVAALAYTFQLYFDFSGYSDMAIGLGWLFNIDLPINFNSPYKATSIIEFWRRWHITLSNFLRDYLYIPLGGNRHGKLRQYANLGITMLLGGLWHGAGWNFVVWGGLHGLYLIVNNIWRSLTRDLPLALPAWFGWCLTWLAVVSGWVLFRALSLMDGMALLQTMFGWRPLVLPIAYENWLGWLPATFTSWNELIYLPELGFNKVLLVLAGLWLSVIALPNTQQLVTWCVPKRWAAGLVGILSIVCLLSLTRVSEFLYFQF